MGVRLSQVIAGAVRTASIDFGGDAPLTITYRPSSVTPASLARARAVAEATGAAAQAESVDLVVAFLSDVLTEWNLCDENGDPLATDRVTLANLPLELLVRVFAEISQAGDDLGEAQSTSVAGSAAN